MSVNNIQTHILNINNNSILSEVIIYIFVLTNERKQINYSKRKHQEI